MQGAKIWAPKLSLALFSLIVSLDPVLGLKNGIFFLKQGQNNAGLSHHGRLQSRIIYQAEEIQSQGPPSCSRLIRSQQRSALLLSRSGGSREHRPGSGSATRIQGAGGAWGSPWDSSDSPQSAPHSDFLDAPFALEAPEVSLKPFCASFTENASPGLGW